MEEEMIVHALKTWPGPFQEVWDRRKSFDIRRNDRHFVIGDLLVLREWDPDTVKGYTGSAIIAEILHVECGTWGLPAQLAVLGIDVIARLGAGKRRTSRG